MFFNATENNVTDDVSLIYAAKISIWKWIMAGAHNKSIITLKIIEFRRVLCCFIGWILIKKRILNPNLIFPFHVIKIKYMPSITIYQMI